jgi:hypothetical protein
MCVMCVCIALKKSQYQRNKNFFCCGNFTAYQWDILLGALTLLGTWRHLVAKVGMSKGRGKQWQTTPKNLPRMQRARAVLVA